jgi:hypothetical protein
MRDIRVANAMQTRWMCALHALHPTWEARFIAWVTFGQYCTSKSSPETPSTNYVWLQIYHPYCRVRPGIGYNQSTSLNWIGQLLVTHPLNRPTYVHSSSCLRLPRTKNLIWTWHSFPANDPSSTAEQIKHCDYQALAPACLESGYRYHSDVSLFGMIRYWGKTSKDGSMMDLWIHNKLTLVMQNW